MTDHTPHAPLSGNPSAGQPADAARPRRRGVTKYAAIAALGLGIIGAGAFASASFSQGPGFMGFGPGGGRGPCHMAMFGGPGGPGGPGGFDPARAEERADRMIRHLAVEVDATAEQQEKLRTIIKGAVKDMVPLGEKMKDTRAQARDLLLGQTVDRAALEKLRADRLALADTMSKRLTQALADAAEVLKPEQRQKLEDLLPEPGAGPGRGFWRGWWRG